MENCKNCGANSFKENKCNYCGSDNKPKPIPLTAEQIKLQESAAIMHIRSLLNYNVVPPAF